MKEMTIKGELELLYSFRPFREQDQAVNQHIMWYKNKICRNYRPVYSFTPLSSSFPLLSLSLSIYLFSFLPLSIFSTSKNINRKSREIDDIISFLFFSFFFFLSFFYIYLSIRIVFKLQNEVQNPKTFQRQRNLVFIYGNKMCKDQEFGGRGVKKGSAQLVVVVRV